MEICDIIFVAYLFMVITVFASGSYRNFFRLNLVSYIFTSTHLLALGLFIYFALETPPWVPVYGGRSNCYGTEWIAGIMVPLALLFAGQLVYLSYKENPPAAFTNLNPARLKFSGIALFIFLFFFFSLCEPSRCHRASCFSPKPDLDNLVFSCTHYWIETDPGNYCTLPKALDYGFRLRKSIQIVSVSGTPRDFETSAYHKSNGWVYKVVDFEFEQNSFSYELVRTNQVVPPIEKGFLERRIDGIMNYLYMSGLYSLTQKIF